MEINNLAHLVKSICAGNYSQAQLVQFINLAQKISLGYLRYQEALGKRISGERVETEMELDDLAIDCIAELFAGDGNGQFPQLRKYFEPKFLEVVNVTDPDVLIMMRRLVVRKTKQELSRIFRERDPEGAKIVRNIKVAIRSSEKLCLFQDLGKEYVFYKNGLDLHDERMDVETIAQYLRKTHPAIPEEVLHSQFVDLYDPSDSVSSSINKLMESIYSQKAFQNFLPVDAVVKLIRKVKFEAFRDKMADEENVPTPLELLESREIESYIQLVMEGMGEKIDVQYIQTEKLTYQKAEVYQKALRDVLYDLIQRRDRTSYFRNLRHYLPELSQREYRQHERSVFEYLAKVAKREFRRHLRTLM